jgi:hypothetical protein
MKRDKQALREKKDDLIQEHSKMVCRYQIATLLPGNDIDIFRQPRNIQYGTQEVAIIRMYLVYGDLPI